MIALRSYVLVCTLIGAFLGTAPSAVQARDCTTEEKAAADKQLWLNKADKQKALERHLPWGTPVPKGQVSNERR